jgi:hypothetical protein
VHEVIFGKSERKRTYDAIGVEKVKNIKVYLCTCRAQDEECESNMYGAVYGKIVDSHYFANKLPT